MVMNVRDHDERSSLRGPGGGTTAARFAAVLLRVELVAVAATFFVFALLHLGIQLGGIDEPFILPATIVETVCGLCMALAAVAAFAATTRAWQTAVTAHGIAIAGVLLGIFAQARGNGGTELNTVYHRTVLAVMVVGLALLLARTGRIALRKNPLTMRYPAQSNWGGEHGPA
jgi:hypothetical protein